MGKGGARAMFLGAFQLKVDEKGRLSIPHRFREILHEKYSPGPEEGDPQLILSPFGQCIIAYPRAEWQWLAQAVSATTALPSMHREVRDLQRVLFGSAAECTVDTQGRVLIPPLLRTKARLDGEVMVVGVNSYFEIWNRGHWEEYAQSLEGRDEEIGQKFAELSDARAIRREHTFGDGFPPRL